EAAFGGRTAGEAGASGTETVLVLTWEPSFCETHSRKTECASEAPDSFAATHFTLHGLWPQAGDHCNVSAALIDADKKGNWETLPAVELSAETRSRLPDLMPGAQSLLERHEWIKHGTCYGGIASAAYFAKALTLLEEINASTVQAF